MITKQIQNVTAQLAMLLSSVSETRTPTLWNARGISVRCELLLSQQSRHESTSLLSLWTLAEGTWTRGTTNHA